MLKWNTFFNVPWVHTMLQITLWGLGIYTKRLNSFAKRIYCSCWKNHYNCNFKWLWIISHFDKTKIKSETFLSILFKLQIKNIFNFYTSKLKWVSRCMKVEAWKCRKNIVCAYGDAKYLSDFGPKLNNFWLAKFSQLVQDRSHSCVWWSSHLGPPQFKKLE